MHRITTLFTELTLLPMLFMGSLLSEIRLPKVLVVTNETLFAEGVCSLLENSDACEVVGYAASTEEALKSARELRPDIVLMDTATPAITSEQVILALQKEMIDTHILLVGHDEHKETIFKGLKAGAKGYVLSTEPSSVLFSAIMDICHGGYSLSPSAARMLVDEYRRIRVDRNDAPYHELTNREREVLGHIVEGYSSQAIANELNISLKTAMGHRAKIMHKLGVHNTAELIKYALRKRLITFHD